MGNSNPNYLSTITNRGDRLQIIIPAKPRWSEIQHLVLWLCGWALGEVMAIALIVNSVSQGTLLNFSVLPMTMFLLVWLLGWGAVGTFTLRKLLKLIRIKEVILVSHDELSLQRIALASQTSQTFSTDRIRYLHASPMAIMFDYEDQTHAFGLSLDISELNYIVSLIEQYIPKQDESRSQPSDW